MEVTTNEGNISSSVENIIDSNEMNESKMSCNQMNASGCVSTDESLNGSIDKRSTSFTIADIAMVSTATGEAAAENKSLASMNTDCGLDQIASSNMTESESVGQEQTSDRTSQVRKNQIDDRVDIVEDDDEEPKWNSSAGLEIKKDESRIRKVLSRIFYGIVMFGTFATTVYVGHVYICILVALIEAMLFHELVRVRYSAYFNRIHNTIPLFRTTQWMWFAVAIFYTYGDFVSDIISNNQELHYLLPYTQYVPVLAFLLYSGTFVLTISTLQRDHIKFQMNQLCWTMLVLLVTVGQLKYIMHNIFNGLIWYVLPCCLVFTNDIMAYVTGMMWGRKFIQRPFLLFSPNKTWEGFLGGWFFTMIIAWHFSRFLAQYTWLTCPTNEFRLSPPDHLNCQLDPIFLPTKVFFPSQVFEIVPVGLIKMIFSPRIVVEICSIRSPTPSPFSSSSPDIAAAGASTILDTSSIQPSSSVTLTPCISGNPFHDHHHYELNLSEYYPIQVHALWLAMFASLVAPFGGFLASAMKRAYGIKDFANFIPGHGGVMDRMDCQFLMALCTWVHYNTFVKLATVSVPKLSYMYSLLSEQEKLEFMSTVLMPVMNVDTASTSYSTTATTTGATDERMIPVTNYYEEASTTQDIDVPSKVLAYLANGKF